MPIVVYGMLSAPVYLLDSGLVHKSLTHTSELTADTLL